MFNKRLIKQKLSKFNISEVPNIDSAKETLLKWQTALKKSDLDKTKETGVQGQFLIKIFEGVLGYKTQSEGGNEWNMFAEPKTDVDSREADGGLGFFSTSYNQTRVVIELKDAKTNLDAKQKGRKNDQSPVEQAFDYLSKFDGCKWAIVSNFKEIRLYSKERGQGFYESIDLLEIGNEDVLKKFLFLFSKNNLISKDRDSVIDDLLKDSFVKEQDISKAFYKTYKETRNHLFNHLSTNNPNIDADTLLEKAQKILDRVIFICFCEDLDLIPAGIFRKLLEAAKLSFAPSETKVWDQAKGLFHSIDKGNPPLNINKFNGGLFKEDQVLDNLIIKDEIILELLKLSEYDFDSDLNVNILGHIFEQSISDLEEIRESIYLTKEDEDYILTEEGGRILLEQDNIINKINSTKGRRKKDGIFYTPEYITRYIVDQAVGGWLMDRKKELGFESLPELTDDDFKSIKTRKGTYKGNNSIEKHRKFWEVYKEKLRNIKVLDPACGSGAFLNQVFDYLYKEGQVVNEVIASLKLGQAEIFDLDKHILNNNIFGVDLNEESVQITKLSLWLKTANKSKELTTLDKNIKCGNSLIDDPEVAGDKAFNWKEEFKEIFDNGGFDVVVGNPPYVFGGNKGISTEEKKFYKNRYQVGSGKVNLFTLFIEKSVEVISSKGKVSFIIPNTFLRVTSYHEARKFVISQTSILSIVDLGAGVFEDATTSAIIFVLEKSINLNNNVSITRGIYNEPIHKLQSDFVDENFVLGITNNKIGGQIIQKMKDNSITLGEICKELIFGVVITNNRNEVVSTTFSPGRKKFLEGKDIGRYEIREVEKYLDYDTKKLHRPRSSKIFEVGEKLLIQRITGGKRPINAAYDNQQYYNKESINNLILKENSGFDIKYILAVLNSSLINWFYRVRFTNESTLTVNLSKEYLSLIPVKQVDGDSQLEIAMNVDKIIELIQELQKKERNFLMLIRSEVPNQEINFPKRIDALSTTEFLKSFNNVSINKKDELISFFNEHSEKTRALRQHLQTIDKWIDDKIYEIYNLNQDEINIINSSTNE